jgi:hypothetical protein
MHVKPGESFKIPERPRGIYERPDAGKCSLGPMFKKMEEVVYELEHFMKGIRVDLKSRVLRDRIYKMNAKYVVMDYTSYESSFKDEVMLNGEMVVYQYLLKHHKERFELIKKTLLGVNQIRNPCLKAKLKARRMSGEVNTSLGNGLANLLMLLFFSCEQGWDLNPTVEGDDSLSSCRVRAVLDGKLFEGCGVTAKVEVFPTFSSGSFCGLRADEISLQNTADPVKTVLKFGWTSSKLMHGGPKKMRALLKAKGLSLAYEYGRSPILWALAKSVLSHLIDADPIWGDGYWESLQCEGYRYHDMEQKTDLGLPDNATREVFAKMYHCPVPMQKDIEQWLLNRKNPLAEITDGPLREWLLTQVDKSCFEYGTNYRYEFKKGKEFNARVIL